MDLLIIQAAIVTIAQRISHKASFNTTTSTERSLTTLQVSGVSQNIFYPPECSINIVSHFLPSCNEFYLHVCSSIPLYSLDWCVNQSAKNETRASFVAKTKTLHERHYTPRQKSSVYSLALKENMESKRDYIHLHKEENARSSSGIVGS